MSLDKLPSILRETEFDERGFAKTKEGILVPAYMASQLGFNVPGQEFLKTFYERLRKEAGILPLCPFKACAEYIDFSKLSDDKTVGETKKFWRDFNDNVVGQVNYGKLMPVSKLLIAILDGGHAVDDGVCSEIGYYALGSFGKKPIVGIRSDFRFSENISAPINPAVRFFIDKDRHGGCFFEGPNAYEDAVKGLAELAEKIKLKK